MTKSTIDKQLARNPLPDAWEHADLMTEHQAPSGVDPSLLTKSEKARLWDRMTDDEREMSRDMIALRNAFGGSIYLDIPKRDSTK
tara:strand:+ start:137 stop:391 length:255 start_codon:yes stop_codon:yes gene_type:complete